jgi:hypothetical protein
MKPKIALLTALAVVLIIGIGFSACLHFQRFSINQGPKIISIKNTFPDEYHISIMRRFEYNVTVFNPGHACNVTVFGELPVQVDGNLKNITEQKLIHLQSGETKTVSFTFNFPVFSHTIQVSASSARFWIES